jgi:SAM-dependent methyltransferase
MSPFQVNHNSAIYYQGRYWNELDCVQSMIDQQIAGGPQDHWFDHFAAKCGRTFERALILNCGNGWVERQLVSEGLVGEAVGIDFSDALLGEARGAAEAAGLPLRYHQMDVNSADFPDGPYDLVVNSAAAHHIAYIDRVFRSLCRQLPEDGWFIAFDYVGPHRNQYRPDAWEEAWRLNSELPEHVRQEMVYPHLPTMLYDDPTEAIHSELIVETLYRYFEVDEFTPVGGAVAYPLMTHNHRLFALQDSAERARWSEAILAVDSDFLATHPDATLFAYFAARPKKSVLRQRARLTQWEAEELEREQRAERQGGEYYPRTSHQTALVELDETRRARDAALRHADESQRHADELLRSVEALHRHIDALQGHADGLQRRADELHQRAHDVQRCNAELQERLDLVDQDRLYSALRRVAAHPAVHKVRSMTPVATLESNLRSRQS